MNITQVRRAVEEALDEFGTVHVLLGPVNYDQSFGEDPEDIKVLAKILVGPAEEPDTEDRVDELITEVPAKLRLDPTLAGVCGDAAVTSCTGHRLYKADPASALPAMMGAEWIIRVIE